MLPGVIATSTSVTQPNGTAMTFDGSAAKPLEVPEKTTADSHLSLGRGIDHILQTTGADGFSAISPLEKSIFDWHIANLEYGCATDLARVSLEHWDQDDEFEFGGKHCLLKKGYSEVLRELAKGINVQLGQVVTEIQYGEDEEDLRMGGKSKPAKVFTAGQTYEAEIVLVTIPLGLLKEKRLRFDPPLPSWKQQAVERLGFGNLNKVGLLFPYVFWDDTVDYFGCVPEKSEDRGESFLFNNLHRCMGQPILLALVAGSAAIVHEHRPDAEIVQRTMAILKRAYPRAPSPLKAVVTRWGTDKYARGSYSYIAVGSTGSDYDLLARPVSRRLFFAGEATQRDHPATVAGAFISGLRQAGIIDAVWASGRALNGPEDTPMRTIPNKRKSNNSKMVKRGNQHEDAAPDSKKDSKKRSRTSSVDTKEEKRSRSSLIDTKEERRRAKITGHTTKSVKEERKKSKSKKDKTDMRETKKEMKKQTKKEPVEPPTANKRRKHNVVVVISDDDADEMIVVDGDDVFQPLPCDIDVQPAPQRHDKERDAYRLLNDEEAVVIAEEEEEEGYGSGEGPRSTRRERQDDTLREDDPLLDAELSQRMTRAMTESHSLNFADICSIDAKFKEIMETVRGYVYDESKTDIEDLKSVASKLLALLDTLGSIRNLSRKEAAFLYRLSSVKAGIEELGLPFGEVVERAFQIARTIWKAFLARFPEEEYAVWLEEEMEKEKRQRERERAARRVIYDDFCLAIRPGSTSKQEDDEERVQCITSNGNGIVSNNNAKDDNDDPSAVAAIKGAGVKPEPEIGKQNITLASELDAPASSGKSEGQPRSCTTLARDFGPGDDRHERGEVKAGRT